MSYCEHQWKVRGSFFEYGKCGALAGIPEAASVARRQKELERRGRDEDRTSPPQEPPDPAKA